MQPVRLLSRRCSISGCSWPGSQYQALLELEQPERDNAGLADLFAHRAPWLKT